MKYSIGHKFLCKEDLDYIYGVQGQNIKLISGKYYNLICYTSYSACRFTTYSASGGGKILFVTISMEDNKKSDFCLVKNYGRYIWDYFYTDSEMRKIKLEKLQYDDKRRD